MKKFIHYNKNFKVIFSCVAIVLLVCTTSIMAYLADADKASNDLVIGASNIQLVENFVPPSKLEPGSSLQWNRCEDLCSQRTCKCT